MRKLVIIKGSPRINGIACDWFGICRDIFKSHVWVMDGIKERTTSYFKRVFQVKEKYKFTPTFVPNSNTYYYDDIAAHEFYRYEFGENSIPYKVTRYSTHVVSLSDELHHNFVMGERR